MPHHITTQGNETYNEAQHWLTKTLTKDLPHAVVVLREDLQATPSAGHSSYNQALDLCCTSTTLRPIGDPHTPTFTPTGSPLDHWLLRLPTNTYDTIYDQSYTTPINTT